MHTTLSIEEKRQIIINKGQNPDYKPCGDSACIPPKGLRNWICEVDGHEDPDRSGLCIHCSAELD